MHNSPHSIIFNAGMSNIIAPVIKEFRLYSANSTTSIINLFHLHPINKHNRNNSIFLVTTCIPLIPQVNNYSQTITIFTFADTNTNWDCNPTIELIPSTKTIDEHNIEPQT